MSDEHGELEGESEIRITEWGWKEVESIRQTGETIRLLIVLAAVAVCSVIAATAAVHVTATKAAQEAGRFSEKP